MNLVIRHRKATVSGFFMALALLQSCQSAHKATASGTTVKAAICAETWLSFPDQPHPMWQEAKVPATAFPPGFVAPYKYKIYRINQDTLQAFFREFRLKNDLGMVVPAGKTCEAFTMRRSGAMSPELQQKYPDIISLQGNGINNKAAELRLDWDGTQVKGQLTHNENIYYITPVNSSEGLIYIIYDRKDTAETKEPIEATPRKNMSKTESNQQLQDR